MPQMTAAFSGWTKQINLIKILDVVVNGFTQERQQTNISFQGIIQPLSPRLIKQYPEGQWSFTWLQIHCMGQNPPLTTNDRIIYNGKKYKVMGQLDYSLNNFTEFHAVTDFMP